MDRTLLPFFAFFMRLFAPRYNARIQFLIAQTRILRSRIDANRIVPTPEEKEELMRWGAAFDHKMDGVMEVVKYNLRIDLRSLRQQPSAVRPDHPLRQLRDFPQALDRRFVVVLRHDGSD